MERHPASERAAVHRGNHRRESILHGDRVDDEREHQPICTGTSGCKSARTRKCSPKPPISSIDHRRGSIATRGFGGFELFAQSWIGPREPQRSMLSSASIGPFSD